MPREPRRRRIEHLRLHARNASITTPPALSALVKNAAAPPGAANQLAFKLASLALDKQWISTPPCVQPCSYRAIYANIGFTLAP
jgi:hypothetical protein